MAITNESHGLMLVQAPGQTATIKTTFDYIRITFGTGSKGVVVIKNTTTGNSKTVPMASLNSGDIVWSFNADDTGYLPDNYYTMSYFGKADAVSLLCGAPTFDELVTFNGNGTGTTTGWQLS